MNKKVLVIGDSCIDVFEYGNCKRICPESPVPILVPTHKIENYGMAFNVYNNLKSLGVDCDLITNNDMPVKIRYIDESSNHMIVRIDRNDTIKSLDWNRIKSINFSDYDALVISDYNKGYISEEQIKYFSDKIDTIFLDTKKTIGSWCKNIKYIKINKKEYTENIPDFFIYEYPHNLIVTLGKEGAMLVYNDDGMIKTELFSIDINDEHPVRDLTGAGDTFLAGLVAEFTKNNDICEAIKFANKCASWSVTQKGVAIVSMNKTKNKKN